MVPSIPVIPHPSTDLVIILGGGLVVLYGLMRGQGALIREAISTYVGLVLAATYGKTLFQYIQVHAGGGYGVSQTIVQMILLLLPVLILQFAHHTPTMRHKSNFIITVILAVLTAMFLISSVLSQFSPVDLNHITEESNLASQIYGLRYV